MKTAKGKPIVTKYGPNREERRRSARLRRLEATADRIKKAEEEKVRAERAAKRERKAKRNIAKSAIVNAHLPVF